MGLAEVESLLGSDRWRTYADEAVALASRFAVVYPGVLEVRGRLRLEHGDVVGAREDVDAARASTPTGNVIVRVALTDTRTHLAEGRADAARETLREAQALAEAARLGPASALGKELARVRALVEEIE